MAATRTALPTHEDELDYLVQAVGSTAGLPVRWFTDDLSPEYMAGVTLPERSEVRAVERGRVARLAFEHGRLVGFDVRSDTNHHSYRVTIRQCSQLVTYFSCTCPSGTYRPGQPVPCAHAAQAARRLVREGLLRPSGALHVPTEKAYRYGMVERVEVPANPFAGLTG